MRRVWLLGSQGRASGGKKRTAGTYDRDSGTSGSPLPSCATLPPPTAEPAEGADAKRHPISAGPPLNAAVLGPQIKLPVNPEEPPVVHRSVQIVLTFGNGPVILLTVVPVRARYQSHRPGKSLFVPHVPRGCFMAGQRPGHQPDGGHRDAQMRGLSRGPRRRMRQ